LTVRPAIAGLAAVLALNACARSDPLSVQDQPGGDSLLLHVLLGTDSHAICIRHELSDPCDETTADILVVEVAEADDVQADWVDGRSVRVTIASGKIARAARSSSDGTINIVMAGS
jgi:hypothetical protein